MAVKSVNRLYGSSVITHLKALLTKQEMLQLDTIVQRYGDEAFEQSFWSLVHAKYETEYQSICRKCRNSAAVVTQLKEKRRYVANVSKKPLSTLTKTPFQRSLAKTSQPIIQSLLVLRVLQELGSLLSNKMLDDLEDGLESKTPEEALSIIKEFYAKTTNESWENFLNRMRIDILSSTAQAYVQACEDVRGTYE